MALVYDNLKGMFKEGKSTSEPKNQSGIMTKQLDALSGTGPEGHSLAYITPEEEKLLQKATGKETMTTAYGIPTYETDLTFEQMEENLKKAGMYDYDELINQEHSLHKGQGSYTTGLNKIILIEEVYDSIAVGKIIENPNTCIKLLPDDLLKLNK